MLKKLDTLIIDLDNTIFDWFSVWYASFHPIYEGVVSHSNCSQDAIEKEIREIHQKHRTSEYSFLIDELNVLKNIDKNGDRREQLKECIQASQSGRDKKLELYDGVFKSLWDIKNKGTKIIAYTETMAFYSAYRLKRFGLDGVIDVLYSPQDHDKPHGLSLNELRRLPDEFYQLQATRTKHTPAGELKPNPKVLIDILREENVTRDTCVYIGDSLFKDVAMARDVGVLDVHAEYGESQRESECELLRKVSHWTEEDVIREKEIIENGHGFEPSIILRNNFSEIFMHCDFQPFALQGSQNLGMSNQLALETWKKTVDVQQHFNDMQMKLRNYAITIVGAMIAAVGFTFQSELELSIFEYQFTAGVLLIIASALSWYAFYFIDRYGYHSLLKGAVDHAGRIENEFASDIPGIGLGTSISKASQNVRFFGIEANSNRRLQIFYFAGLMMQAILFVGFMLASSEVTPSKEPSQKPSIEKQANTN